ncbi:MAG: DUF1549 domain-containing protein [Phycisphaerae bacterium]|nr:DUF1549 domain-containing protein [Phycisphaerae bacterium]
MRLVAVPFVVMAILATAPLVGSAGAGAGARPAGPSAAAVSTSSGTAPPVEPIDYGRDVRPILAARCFTCHGPDGSSRKADLRLDDPHDARRSREDGIVVVSAGLPEESEALRRIMSGDPEERMPPQGEGLSPREVAVLRRWIEEGATYNEAWSWRAIVPTATPPVADESWASDPLDRFVLARLESRGVRPAPRAEPRELLRRVSYDLVGLPPTPEDLARFAEDPSPAALAREVDRLLASPAFGERWGRHWLDLVRYAETYGHEFDFPIPQAWRYRDAVIRAFNEDVPYDRLILEHLAGDQLEDPRRDPATGIDEGLVLTGFWWLSQGTHAPVDVARDEADRIDNQIDVLSKTFLGVTAACARCHDHKFDAITQADYYGLSAHLKRGRRGLVELDPDGSIGRVRRESIAMRRAVEAACRGWRPLRLLDDRDPAPSSDPMLADFAVPRPPGFAATGQAFATEPSQLPHLEPSGDAVALAPVGVASSRAGGDALAGTLRSASFPIDRRYLHQRLRGRGTTRVIVDGFHLDEHNPLLFEGHRREVETGEGFDLVTWDLERYRGHRAYVEWIDRGEGFLEVDWLLASDEAAPPALVEAPPVLVAAPAGASLALRRILARPAPEPVRVLAMVDGSPWIERVRLRGDPRRLGEVVEAGHPASLDEGEAVSPGDRLALARRLIDPEHPLVSRVMANRVWHHLVGRGIVETTDDFGALGSPPSDPALLDHLADRLRSDWSIKRLVRAIVLSSTYAMSVHGDRRAEEVDPRNEIPHRAALRRLDAESIRDSLIVLSGRMDPTMFGPGVAVHLTEFMDGRGRPGASGPLDGGHRRSIYLEVRRNFPEPFLQSFDLPIPTTTMGRRHRSNVPGQALAMLNSPLVHQLVGEWGTRIAAMPAPPEGQVARMFEEALGRRPSAAESGEAVEFLREEMRARGGDPAPDAAALAALGHVLVNAKEFLFLP